MLKILMTVSALLSSTLALASDVEDLTLTSDGPTDTVTLKISKALQTTIKQSLVEKENTEEGNYLWWFYSPINIQGVDFTFGAQLLRDGDDASWGVKHLETVMKTDSEDGFEVQGAIGTGTSIQAIAISKADLANFSEGKRRMSASVEYRVTKIKDEPDSSAPWSADLEVSCGGIEKPIKLGFQTDEAWSSDSFLFTTKMKRIDLVIKELDFAACKKLGGDLRISFESRHNEDVRGFSVKEISWSMTQLP